MISASPDPRARAPFPLSALETSYDVISCKTVVRQDGTPVKSPRPCPHCVEQDMTSIVLSTPVAVLPTVVTVRTAETRDNAQMSIQTPMGYAHTSARL